MFVRIFSTSLILLTVASMAWAQGSLSKSTSDAGTWKQQGLNIVGSPNRSTQSEQSASAYRTAQSPRGSTSARVGSGSGTLPNDHGQVWREYDISPYTQNSRNVKRPEQLIVDWILRETGYEAWHSEPLGLLSANNHTLSVYHTEEMQAVVQDIVDRFLNSQKEKQPFSLRIVTIDNPDWRAKAMRLMKSIPVQTQGLQGWIMPKEDAGLLMSELRKRTDYREHSSPQLLVNNGQSSLLTSIRTRAYVRGVIPRSTAWPGYEVETGNIEEGYSLEFSPLISLDHRTVDAIVKMRINQIERMRPVMIDVPSPVAPNQRTKIEVPQMTTSILHERFRWPVDHILL